MYQLAEPGPVGQDAREEQDEQRVVQAGRQGYPPIQASGRPERANDPSARRRSRCGVPVARRAECGVKFDWLTWSQIQPLADLGSPAHTGRRGTPD